MLYRGSDLISLGNIVYQEMPKITEWFASNKLNVDVNKSTAIPFHEMKMRDFLVLFLRKANNTEHPTRGCPHLVLISQLIRLKQCR